MPEQDFYFRPYETRRPPQSEPKNPKIEFLWQLMMTVTLALGAWYLIWRWGYSLNYQAMPLSILVATAETLAYLGSLIFAYDIWACKDTPRKSAPTTRANAGLSGTGLIKIDIFITTYDEDEELVRLSIQSAKAVIAPPNSRVRIYVLDDGARSDMKEIARQEDVNYLTRSGNAGFKAGNLKNALFNSTGDFFVICDADTRLFPKILMNTMGYFRDPKVAWVQTPHWFYDIPDSEPLWHLGTRFARRYLGKTRHKALQKNQKTGTEQDPFLVESGYFFDVIQRRRNRNNASFCCGAGSIHRREAAFTIANFLWKKASVQNKTLLAGNSQGGENILVQAAEIAPFQFHVSEDLLTSIAVHSEGGWRSVFHPQVESRMLSPWGMKAWAVQKLKYAGGTFDIALNRNPLFRSRMPWRIKLHYLATFFSYFSCFWILVLLLTPIFTLITGISPVSAYSVTFFAHLIPLLIANEIAMTLGGWGHSIHKSAQNTIATLPINFRAFYLALRKREIKFHPTPKTPKFDDALNYVRFHLIVLALSIGAIIYGIFLYLLGVSNITQAALIVNIFWAAWNAWSLLPIIRAAFWTPAHLPKHSAATPKSATNLERLFYAATK